VWVLPPAVDFTLLPQPVDAGIVGSGSAIGAVIGGTWSFLLGYSLDDMVAHGALFALALGAAGLYWLLGLSALELVR
jgi:hypothetical protein